MAAADTLLAEVVAAYHRTVVPGAEGHRVLVAGAVGTLASAVVPCKDQVTRVGCVLQLEGRCNSVVAGEELALPLAGKAKELFVVHDSDHADEVHPPLKK